MMAGRAQSGSRKRLALIIRHHYALFDDALHLKGPSPFYAQNLLSLRSAYVERSFATSVFASSTQSTASRRGPVSFLSLALTAATGAGLLYWFQTVQKEKLKALAIKTETAGRAAIGGPFQLLDQNGKIFTDRDLLGSFSLLYFGFTHCPDICPDELEKMAEAIDMIEEETGREVRPIFITLDPERDTVKQVRSYVSEFHPRLIGLTGSAERVKEAARQYRVYFTKTNESSDYLVDHSIIMYLVDPKGHFVTFYGKNFTTEQLAKSIAQYVSNWTE